MKYAPKEVQKYLPKERLVSASFNPKWLGRGYSLFTSMRIANAICLWSGPFEILLRRPWLLGPAIQMHRDAFIKAGREDLLPDDEFTQKL